jgi:hypothetical protein
MTLTVTWLELRAGFHVTERAGTRFVRDRQNVRIVKVVIVIVHVLAII